MGQKLVRFLVRLLLPLIARVEVRGLENIPMGQEKTALIVAPNHLGRLDSALNFYAIDRDDLIMPVAEKYQHSFFFNLLIETMGGFYINRFDADVHAIREVLARLKQGGYLTMAPEGTRSPTEALQEGRPGVAYIASKAGVPIVPVGITGTEDRVIMENLRHLRRGHITAHAGKPFTLEPIRGGDREAQLREYTDEIMCRIAALLPESYRGVYADHPRLKQLLAEEHA